eukprot:403333563
MNNNNPRNNIPTNPQRQQINFDDDIPIQIDTTIPKNSLQSQNLLTSLRPLSHKTDEVTKSKKSLDKEEIKAQIETITQYNKMLSKMEINEKVLNCDIHELFLFYNVAFFQGKLDCVILEWSTKMTLCAGICYYQNGLCTLRLSKQLLKYRSEKELQETLIHEMIHAYLFLTKKSYSRDGSDGHGPDFQGKMREINEQTGFNITIYHSFNDEVESYRQHVWLCNGKCRKQPPHYGMVKRQMNKPPGTYDDWWEKHQKSCGGQFIKIAEPEGYNPPKPKKDQVEASNKQLCDLNTLDKFFQRTSNQKEPQDNSNKKPNNMIQSSVKSSEEEKKKDDEVKYELQPQNMPLKYITGQLDKKRKRSEIQSEVQPALNNNNVMNNNNNNNSSNRVNPANNMLNQVQQQNDSDQQLEQQNIRRIRANPAQEELQQNQDSDDSFEEDLAMQIALLNQLGLM